MRPNKIANETAWQIENGINAAGHTISENLIDGIRQEILQEINNGLLFCEDDVIAYVQEHVRLIGQELMRIDIEDIYTKVG